MKHPPLATLRFFDDELHPDVIAKIITEKPSSAAAKGAPFLRRLGTRPIKARTGTWFITTQRKRLGNRPDDHLAWVIRLARDHMHDIRKQIPNVKADLSLLVHDPDFKLSDLSNDLLRRAVEIGDLEVEVPERGMDLLLNSGNLGAHLTAQT